jgi:hypothetical protein
LCLAKDRASGPGRRAGVGERSEHRHLTRRICLSAESAANVASYAARRRPEHRSGIGALRRSTQHEPLPSTACRDARRDASRKAFRDAQS